MVSPKLRVLLLGEYPDRTADVRRALVAAGYDVLSALPAPLLLYERIARDQPDVIIIDTDSPSRDVLEHIALISREAPKPIVMFSGDRDGETIRASIRAGVTAYIVDGLSEARLQPIVSVALERFEAEQEIKRELTETKTLLAERKSIERAKGLIMKQTACDEQTAFNHLRSFAMDRGLRMAQAAERVIAMEQNLA